MYYFPRARQNWRALGLFWGEETKREAYQFYAIALLEVQFLIKIALREGQLLMIFALLGVQFRSDLDVWVCVLSFVCEKECVSLRHYL